MGYVNYSMSENAKACYDSGEMPESKWTKEALIEAIDNAYGEELAEKFKNFTTAQLRSIFLDNVGWHHTSNRFNRTDFYAFNECIEKEELLLLALKKWDKEPRKEKVVETKLFLARWKEWTGTRNHPHCQERISIFKVKFTNKEPGMAVMLERWNNTIRESETKKRYDSLSIIKEIKIIKKNSIIWGETK